MLLKSQQSLATSLYLLGMLTSIIQPSAVSQPITCTPLSGCSAFAVTTESINVSSCNRNAGSIDITISSRLNSPTSGTLTLTGPITKSLSVTVNPGDNSFPKLFTQLPNGTYTLSTQIVLDPTSTCTFICNNIVVATKKLNCQPLLCCCTI